MMVELRNRGKSVIMSTHRMNEIEELCDRVLMINQGQVVLYGGLAEIKSKFRNNAVIVEYEGDPGDITGIIRRNDLKQGVELVLDETTTPQQILERLVNKGVKVNRFELSTPSLNDIFIKVAGNGRE